MAERHGHADLADGAPRARRSPARGARAADVPRRPPGWEFTPIDKLDLDAVPAAPGGEATSLVDVDGAVSGSRRGADASRARSSCRCALAAERYAELVEAPPRHGRRRRQTPFTARNDAHWTDGAFVYVPRGVTVDAPIVLTAVARAGRHRAALAHADRARGGRRRPRCGSSPLVGRRDGAGQRRRRARRRPERAPALRRRARTLNEKLVDLRRPARRGRAATRSLDWIDARLRLGQRQGLRMETQLAGPGADGTVTGAYATHGRQHLDFDTLAGARRAEHDVATSPSAASSPTARARSGAG